MTLPTEEEVYEFVKRRGSVTNDQMYQEGYGDVGRGHDTVSKLRKLADEGKLKLNIREVMRDHVLPGGVGYRSPEKIIITWSIMNEQKG